MSIAARAIRSSACISAATLFLNGMTGAGLAGTLDAFSYSLDDPEVTAPVSFGGDSSNEPDAAMPFVPVSVPKLSSDANCTQHFGLWTCVQTGFLVTPGPGDPQPSAPQTAHVVAAPTPATGFALLSALAMFAMVRLRRTARR